MKLFLGLVGLLLCFDVAAHSGGTDKYGCHHDRKNGGYHCHNGVKAPQRQVSSENLSEQVAFNTKTKKIHRINCSAARACTVNCVTISKRDAIKRGGVACGLCGG